MELQALETKFMTAVNMIEEKGKQYADARAIYNYLSEMKKVVLANESKKSDGKSNAEKEMNGLTSEVYSQHLHGLKEAEGDYLRLQAEYERWKAQTEALRTLISLEKEKIKNFGG